MLFTEARFLVFFALVFAMYWGMRGHRGRKLLLLVASYVFYGAWRWEFLFLILASTVLDYGLGIALGRTADPRARRRWLVASLVGNLGSLALFKYFDFFMHSGVGLLQLVGVEVAPRTLGWLLPVGISFYTFQSLSYTIDVYRRHLEPVRSFADFALFVTFFPQLVAGPIVRAADFLPQLDTRKRIAEVPFRACLSLFLIGYIKKACVSDNFAPLIDQVFGAPGEYGTGALWLAALMYAVRIYCDFSGYSDMAIATAGLLGYRLAVNFDHPYVATSITDFWRRWHISLSTWFRDYLYIPLGGNRGSPLRTYRNLLVVFFLCGLWHGANWTFVAWGLYHGGFLILERRLGLRIERSGGWRALPSHLYVMLVVTVGWVLFRSQTLGDALLFLRGMFTPLTAATAPTVDLRFAWIVLVFALVHAWDRSERVQRTAERTPDWLFALAYGGILALVLPFAAADYTAFIYFQF